MLRKFLVGVLISWGLVVSPALAQVNAITPQFAAILARASAAPSGAGDPTALVITSAIFSSPTDLPLTQFVNGWTGDLTISGTTPAGATTAYGPCISAGAATGICGSWAAPALSFPVTYPGYDSTATATTGSTTIAATSWLRQVYNNATLPTESANGGNVKIAVSFNDFIHASDTVGPATTLAGLYVSNVTSTAKSGIPVTNNSTRTYERPVGAWINQPGDYIGASTGYTVEFFAGQSYGAGGVPLAAAKFTACDAGQVHCATPKVVSAITQSAKQLAIVCTGTNGSAVLTSCGNTYGVIDGERFTVKGIPGQPRLLSHTANTLTFGTPQTCVTTLNSGNITVGTVASLTGGDALADGGFTGATLTDANITTPAGVATISSATLTADITTASGKSTAAVIHAVGATAVTATAAHACTINHVFQGSTGSVTAYLGNPVPVYSATFAASDFTTFTDGAINFRAQGYPVRGDVILDTQLGADGTRCDWWYINVSGTGGAGVCDSGNAAWLSANGTDNSPNLHNLWAYLDKTAGKYSPAYVWVTSTGTCTTSACVSASATDPTAGGATASAATIATAITALKSFNTARGATHNDASGGIICLTASASPYASMAADESAAVPANTPPLIITSATANGGNCSTAPSVNSDLTVAITTNATVGNRRAPLGTRFNNLFFSGAASTLQANETATNTAFTTNWVEFNYDKLGATATLTLNKVGVWDIANSFVDQSAFDGRYLQPAGGIAGAMRTLFASTAICNGFAGAASTAGVTAFNTIGNVGFDCAPNPPGGLDSINTTLQPLSQVLAYDKWMVLQGVKSAWITPAVNLLLTTNIWEENNSSTSPAVQVSGDSANTPVSNVNFIYNTVAGSRVNNQYLEGVPITVTSVVGTGGTWSPTGAYYIQVTYALKSNPTVETSTDGIWYSAGTPQSWTAAATSSATVDLPCNPNYVAYIYVGQLADITGSGNTASLGHYATVSAADAKQLAMCQTVTITGQGSAHAAPSVAGSTAGNMLKTQFFHRFNIMNALNIKPDTYGGATGASGAVASGGKIGGFEGRFHVSSLGNVFLGTSIGNGYGPTNGIGEFGGRNDQSNPSNGALSYVLFKSDRSIGNLGATPTSPATNLGHGNYCIDTSVTTPLSLVPTGYAQWPWDIQGNTRLNNATGAAGAYEQGCS
jgi:hypothetical protein